MNTIFKNFKFNRCILGLFISNLGSGFLFIIYSWKVMEITKSEFLVSLLFATLTIASLLANGLGVFIVDKIHRQRGIVLLNILGLLNSGLLTIFFGFLNSLIYIYYITFFIQGFIWGLLFNLIPAFFHEFIAKNEYKSANSYIEVSVQSGVIIGSGLSGFLYASIGFRNLLLIDAVTFLIAALLLIDKGIVFFNRSIQENPDEKEKSHYSLKEVLKFISYNINFFKLIIFILLPLTFIFTINVGLISMISDIYAGNSKLFGIFDMLSGIGGILVGIAISNIKRLKGNKFYFCISFSILVCILLSLIVIKTAFITCVLMFLLGFFATGLRIFRGQLIMDYVPNSIIGRVYSIIKMFSITGQLIFSPIIGFLIEKYSYRTGFLFLAGIFFISLLVFIFSKFPEKKIVSEI